MNAIKPPPTPPLPVLPVEYATAAPSNRAAVWALVAGLVGFVLPVIPAIVAIILGRRAFVRINEEPRRGGRGMAGTAIVLGIAGLLFWGGVALASIPVIRQARLKAQTTACLSNLRQLGIACMMYSTTSGGDLPPTLDAVVAQGMVGGAALACPACAGTSKPPVFTSRFGRCDYVYLGAGVNLSRVRSSGNVPLAYDPLSNHGGSSICILFCDGHAEVRQGAAAQAFIAAQAAPPSGAGAVPSAVGSAPAGAQVEKQDAAQPVP